MSFSSEIKSTIVEGQYKKSCCRKALLLGIMFSRAFYNNGKIEVSVVKEYVDFVCKLVREFYGKDIEISRSYVGGRRYILTFTSETAAKYLGDIENGAELFASKCSNCQSSFLRGVFLASARITSPEKGYSIYFSLGERAECFSKYLSELDIKAKISGNGEQKTLYFKSEALAESFYTYALMNKALFTIMDVKAKKELANIVRLGYYRDTNNINKATDTANRQASIIAALDKANLLSSLPDELEATARLRLEHPDFSLVQLSMIATPPISKPGLSHRLKKIMDIAKQLLPHDVYEAANKLIQIDDGSLPDSLDWDGEG